MKDRVFTSPSPASRACDADSCDNGGVFGGKMTPLFIVSTAEYEPSLPLLMILYGFGILVTYSTDRLLVNRYADTQCVPTCLATNSVICQCLPLLSIFIGSCVHKFKSAPRAELCRHAADTREERMSVTGDFLQCDIISLLHHYCVGDIITDI